MIVLTLNLRHEISPKVICEVTFSTYDFCNIFRFFRHTCKLFKSMFNNVQTKGNGEIDMAKL